MRKTKIIAGIFFVAIFTVILGLSFLFWQKQHSTRVLAQYSGYTYDLEFNRVCSRYISSPSYPLYVYSDIPASYASPLAEIQVTACESVYVCDASYASCTASTCDSEGKCKVRVTAGNRLYFRINNDASDPFCVASHTCLQIMATEDTSSPSPAPSTPSPSVPSSPAPSTPAPSSPSTSTSGCGNGMCEQSQFFFLELETCENCPEDCGECVGASCSTSYECESNFCYQSKCQRNPECGDYSCAGNETCISCPQDCGECKKGNGAACSAKSDCTSGYCVHSVCRPSATYCGDKECDTGESCEDCTRDCGACDGADCTNATSCAAGYCVHKKCRSSAVYCGDSECDAGESCAACAADCCGSDLKVSFSTMRLQLKPGDTTTLQVNLKNSGKSAAQNVSWTILADKDSLINISPKDKKIGNIVAGAESAQTIKITAKSAGEAYLAIHFRGDNFGSILKFVRVSIESGLALDVPENIFLLPQEENQFGVFLINQGSESAVVRSLTLESLNPEVIEIKDGKTMEVRGQGEGIKSDQLFSTESEDILKAIAPRPKIQAQGVGETELVFRLNYYFSKSKRTESLEKKTKVKVSAEQGGRESMLGLQIIPGGVVLGIGEAREVKIILKNQGSSVIREGKVILQKPGASYFEATEEVRFGAIEPGQKAEAKIYLVATDETPSFFTQNNAAQEKAITDSLVLDGHYQTIDGREFNFKKEIKVSLVKERLACKPEDPACSKAVDCLVELSNSMSCTLEVADIIPYLDKPVAAVLATADICEISKREANGDQIGAAITSLLAASDLADNVADSVPVAGNLVSSFADIVEGAADCAEGFIYDGIDQYCASGRGTGYTGCAENIFKTIAEISGQAGEPQAARQFVVAMVGSPVSLQVVDSDDKVLTPADGVIVIQDRGLKLALIKNPQNFKNAFNFKISGQAQGEYSLHLGLVSGGQVLSTRTIENQPINQDQIKNIAVLATASGRGVLNNLFLGKSEIARFQGKVLLNKFFGTMTGALILLAIFVLIFAALVGLMLWRRRRKN